MKKWLFFSLFLCYTFLLSAQKHVFLIGIDGMSPDGIQKAETPHLDALIKNGTHTFTAEAVSPTVSGSNWASLMMGAGPEQHQIYANDWRQKDFQDSTFCEGKKGQLWPTIFSVIRSQQAEAKLACIHDWSTIDQYIEKGVCNILADTKGEDHSNEEAIRYLLAYQPTFLFLHLDHVDHAGHRYGHGTKEYYTSVEKADRLIGDFIAALQKADIYEESILIITSDHGGLGKGHGGDTPEEKQIPIIISGKGIQKGKKFKEKDIMIYDIPATIASLFGYSTPECWIGRPLKSAFK